jgi:predicted DNA-binding protein
MERTQIYLSERQTVELDRRARERGTTRSALIREALEQYLGPVWDPDAFIAALNEFAGIAADRDIMADYRELKRRNRERLRRLWAPQEVILDEDEITS